MSGGEASTALMNARSAPQHLSTKRRGIENVIRRLRLFRGGEGLGTSRLDLTAIGSLYPKK